MQVAWREALRKCRFAAGLVAVPGDPLADIGAMERLGFVMKGGAVERDDLSRR